MYKEKELHTDTKKEKFINELHSKDDEKSSEKGLRKDKDTKKDELINLKSSSHRNHSSSSKSSSSTHRSSSTNKDREHKSVSSSKRGDDGSTSKFKELRRNGRDRNQDDKKSNSKSTPSSSKFETEVSPKLRDSSANENFSKEGTDTSKLKSTVGDETKLTRKEVTAEDVAKAENLIKKALEAASTTTYQTSSASDREGSEAIASLSTESGDHIELTAKDANSELVSSTVTIKTPDTSGLNVSSDSNPVVWKGDINMPDVAKFSVTAKQVSGTTDYLTVDLKEALKIVGRIAPNTVWDYVLQVSDSPSKEILLIRLEPTTDDEKINYTSFFNYLQQRNR